MTDSIYKTTLILGFLSALVSTLLFGLLPKGAFYYFNSFAFLCYACALFCKSNKSKGNFRTFELIVLLCTISNFVDEVFYNATLIEFNDFIRSFLIILTAYKCQRILNK